MNFNITLPERMILESLTKAAKTVTELNKCTGLEKSLLQKIVPDLISKNLVVTFENKYMINTNIDKTIKQELNNPQNMKAELNEITSALIRKKIDKAQDSAFKLKKVYLTSSEEKIFNAHLYNIESFLNSISNKKEPTSQEVLFVWGQSTYGSITNEIIAY